MKIEIKIPSVGESIKEAVLVEWYKKNGDRVHKDDPLFLIETDKVTLEVTAEADGVLEISVAEGETVAIGAVVGIIDTEGGVIEPKAAPDVKTETFPQDLKKEPDASSLKSTPKIPEAPVPSEKVEKTKLPETPVTLAVEYGGNAPIFSPSVRRLISERDLDPTLIPATGPGGRITKGDVLLYLEKDKNAITSKPATAASFQKSVQPTPAPSPAEEAAVSRKPMSPIRRRIAARLVKAKQETAMLTTFNDVDMTRVMQIRALLKERFRGKHDIPLGLMSFFIKATIEALKEFPELNATIDGEDIVYHHYYHIGIAIGAERGLVVPVIRHANQLGFAELEGAIVGFVKKINENRLELADLEGGTFTLSNGGIYGSLLSTPILNMPQSGILGLHRIEDRPVARNGRVEIRSMMYIALSYDHRIVDGREAVTFLKRIKEYVENPELLIMEI